MKAENSILPSVPHPVTFRMPRRGERDPYFGMTLTWWNQMVLPNKANAGKPPIKSLSLKAPCPYPGSRPRGRFIRCILFESAKAYFEKLESDQLPDAA